jgi:Protein kinase domain
MTPAQSDYLLSGRYRLRTVIGRGGMGVVWLAGDELLHRDVAVKETIWPAHLDEPERATIRQRALREARTAAGLDHPNIVKVFDVVEDDGRPWMVMQLVPFRRSATSFATADRCRPRRPRRSGCACWTPSRPRTPPACCTGTSNRATFYSARMTGSFSPTSGLLSRTAARA